MKIDMAEATRARIQAMGLDNANRNPPFQKSIRELTVKDDVVIIAAGPSIKKHDPARLLHAFSGTIICADSALRYCLTNNLDPDIVVSVDPHARIATWFGAEPADDYFKRQDMDAEFDHAAVDALICDANQLKLALASSTHPDTLAMTQDFDIYWWNPMYDGGEIDAGLRKMNGYPSMNAGGNVGASCWMLAQVLGAKRVALTGMDFGYYDDTPFERTQYYKEAVELFGDYYRQIYTQIYNPFVEQFFYTDPAYLWYRDCFLEMLEDADCETTNCTGGGILFGDKLQMSSLESWLAYSL